MTKLKQMVIGTEQAPLNEPRTQRQSWRATGCHLVSETIVVFQEREEPKGYCSYHTPVTLP